MNDEQTEKINTYIKQQIQMGVEPNQIVAGLMNAGWPAEAAQQQVQAVLTAMAPAVPTDTASLPQPYQAGAFQFQPPRPASMKPRPTTQGFIGRMKTGLLLFKQSMVVLKSNKYLLRYLFMTYLAVMLISAAFITLYLVGDAAILRKSIDDGGLSTPFGFAIMFLNYLLIYFCINYYAAGLTANILDIFSGHKQDYSVYMSAARSKIGQLFVLSFISSTIGVLLRFIAERLGRIGRIIEFLIGTAWSLAVMFTVPIIVTSDTSALRAIKASAGLLKRTWGESLTTKVSVNFPLFLVNLLVILIFGLLLPVIVFKGGSVAFIVWFSLYFIVQMTIAVIGSFANSLVNTALFFYANYHQVPAAFDEALLNQVFVARKRRFFKRKRAAPAQ